MLVPNDFVHSLQGKKACLFPSSRSPESLACPFALTCLPIDSQTIQIIKQAYLSPLAAVPNAGRLAPLSRLLWAFPQEYSGEVTLELPRLHAKSGKGTVPLCA